MSDASAPDPPPSLPFERRRAPRRTLSAEATVLCLDGEQFGRTDELAVVDFSDGGFLGVGARPVAPGSRLSVGFSRPTLLARRGVVRRCVPCGRGYAVAVQFALGLAA